MWGGAARVRAAIKEEGKGREGGRNAPAATGPGLYSARSGSTGLTTVKRARSMEVFHSRAVRCATVPSGTVPKWMCAGTICARWG